jgi:alcohol dehydrogenase (cytochrome c)
MNGREVEYIPGQNFTGAEFEVFKRDGADHIGELQAWDLDTGERGWNHELPSRTGGAVLTTAGGLVFLGGGDFRAFHAWSGRLLWRIRTNYLRTGVPTSYAVHGVQYIAVQSGA